MGVALDLREEKSALQRGEKRHGQVVGVDVRREMPSGVKGSQSVADGD
jgi:hypothetical protein